MPDKTCDKQRKVMVVDDAQIDRYIAEKVMINYNFSSDIIVFGSAREALDYLSCFKTIPEFLPDIIFLDINMPEMDGFQFLDEYRSLPQVVKVKCNIFMLSSSVDPKDVERALGNEYVCSFVNKPLDAKKLSEVQNLTKQPYSNGPQK